MSDIIAHAQRLLDGATPGPWELTNGEIHQIQHTPQQCTSLRCDHRWPVLSESWGESPAVAANDADITLMAASRELAQELAKETWEYSYQVQNTIGMWEHPTTQPGDPEKWWETKGEAEEVAIEAHACGYPIRLVCRRVSPPQITQ